MPPPAPASALFYAPSPIGGIAEHAHYQAAELARRGTKVTMLCQRGFVKQAAGYRQWRILRNLPGLGGAGRLRKLRWPLEVVIHQMQLLWWVLRLRPDVVVLEAYTEYFSPLWALPHIVVARLLGIPYVANFHDPVRERLFGPAWLHRLTLALCNAMLSGGLIHGPVPAEARLPARFRMRIAPLGLFEDTASRDFRFDLRERLAIAPGRFVVLAFGHIVERKNLDLVITALVEVPQAVLVIAGEAASERQRQPAFYRELAERLGVGERVRIVSDYIGDEDVPAYFAAADAVALTYNREFVSQSGVLQHAVAWNKPILASSGPGPLRDTVEGFGLGIFVNPDDTGAIAEGLRRIVAGDLVPRANFDRYKNTASWRENIDQLVALVDDIRRGRSG